jgi:hypothetical protein
MIAVKQALHREEQHAERADEEEELHEDPKIVITEFVRKALLQGTACTRAET